MTDIVNAAKRSEIMSRIKNVIPCRNSSSVASPTGSGSVFACIAGIFPVHQTWYSRGIELSSLFMVVSGIGMMAAGMPIARTPGFSSGRRSSRRTWRGTHETRWRCAIWLGEFL